MRSLLRIATLLTLLLGTAAVTAFVLVRQPSLGRTSNLVTHRASAARLEHDVRWLTAEPRSADHAENLDKVADYLATESARSGAVVTRQPFRARGHIYQNVIASFGPGSAPSLIVGAHYDVFSTRRPLPGADDNASATADLLQLARLLQHEKLQRRVDLVAYSNEEPPFFGSDEMGSAIHAASIHGARLPPMISLEMIGYYTENQPHTHSLLDYLVPRHGRFVVIAGRWRDRALARQFGNAFNAASRTVPAYHPPAIPRHRRLGSA